MSNINPAQLDRVQQRFWLALLAAGVGLATLHLVAFPQSPPLPLSPGSALLPRPWQAAAASIGTPNKHTIFPQPDVAIGPSKRFAHGRDWLLLTPLASWWENGLDPGGITTTIPGLHLQEVQLQEVKLKTLPQAKQQIARGLIQGQTSYQTCLTRTGAFAFTAAGLRGTSGAPHVDFLRTLLRGRVPPLPRPSYSCLLVTTNSRQALAGGAANSNLLLAALASHTQWPR